MISDRLRIRWGWNSLNGQDCVFVCRWQKAEISCQHSLSMVILKTEHNVPSLHHSHSESYQSISLTSHHSLSSLFLCPALSSLLTHYKVIPFAPPRSRTDHFKYFMYRGYFRRILDSTGWGQLSWVWPVSCHVYPVPVFTAHFVRNRASSQNAHFQDCVLKESWICIWSWFITDSKLPSFNIIKRGKVESLTHWRLWVMKMCILIKGVWLLLLACCHKQQLASTAEECSWLLTYITIDRIVWGNPCSFVSHSFLVNKKTSGKLPFSFLHIFKRKLYGSNGKGSSKTRSSETKGLLQSYWLCV